MVKYFVACVIGLCIARRCEMVGWFSGFVLSRKTLYSDFLRLVALPVVGMCFASSIGGFDTGPNPKCSAYDSKNFFVFRS